MQAEIYTIDQSEALYSKANELIPGGVNSPVRAFKSVGGCPRFIRRAQGPYLYDVDNNRYVDYIGSWGPMILGHAHPAVLETINTVSRHGLSFGAPCELEVELAQVIHDRMPSMEKIRMVNSGTEATMSAIRLARAATGRNKIIKFSGCYHGHADSFLVNAGSGALTLGVPSSPGVPEATSADTLNANYNDIDSVIHLFDTFKDQIAAVIVEPIAGNMNMVLPKDDFLEKLRRLTDQHNSLLIFDEVMTGFRVALGGAQALYGVTPDLTTLGKIIGGGLPVGAFGGKRDLMDLLAPVGPVYQAGTLSGNPLAMAAGLTTIKLLSHEHYAALEQKSNTLIDGIKEAGQRHNINVQGHCKGGMFGLFFTDQVEPVSTFSESMSCNHNVFKHFFHGMLKSGHYFAPSSYEAGFISLSHTLNDINSTINSSRLFFDQYEK